MRNLSSSRIYGKITACQGHSINGDESTLLPAIGVPLLFNATVFGILFAHMNARFDAVDMRFDECATCGEPNSAASKKFSTPG